MGHASCVLQLAQKLFYFSKLGEELFFGLKLGGVDAPSAAAQSYRVRHACNLTSARLSRGIARAAASLAVAVAQVSQK